MELKIIPKTKLFAWKFIRSRILFKINLRKMTMVLNSDCPFYDSHLYSDSVIWLIRYGLICLTCVRSY